MTVLLKSILILILFFWQIFLGLSFLDSIFAILIYVYYFLSLFFKLNFLGRYVILSVIIIFLICVVCISIYFFYMVEELSLIMCSYCSSTSLNLSTFNVYYSAIETLSFITAYWGYFQIIALLLLILVLILLSVLLFIIAMDNIYRPNIPQYPFNIWLDRIFPFILLFTPTILALFLKDATWFTTYTIILLMHCFILIPFFYWWARLRNWDSSKLDSYYSWNHPTLYKHIAIAILYPSIWGIYLSSSRYLHLGSTIDVNSFITNLDPDWIFLFFLIPFTSIWIRLFLWSLLYLRSYLWCELTSLYYSIHIKCLQYLPYFFICQTFYKLYHLLACYISLNGPVFFQKTSSYSLRKRIMNKLFYNPKWFLFIIFCFLAIELWLTKVLYYSLYLLFLYPIIYGIFVLFCNLGRSSFVFDVCFSDYIAERWKSPRYPIVFWDYFDDADYWYKLELKPTVDFTLINQQRNLNLWKSRKTVTRQHHESQLVTKVASRRFNFKTAASYRQLNGVRYMHTDVIVKQPLLHSATAFFCRTLYKVALINNNFSFT